MRSSILKRTIATTTLHSTRRYQLWEIHLPKSRNYSIDVKYTNASNKGRYFQVGFKQYPLQHQHQHGTGAWPQVRPEVSETTITGREYKYIDFILPGMLGFSLLSSGVFGTAFVFLSLRITLVIKRFFATPVKRYSIVLGEAIARVTFALMGALVIIAIGHYAFGFTLVHGFVTVLNMPATVDHWPYYFYGLWLYHFRRRKKRKRRTAVLANIVTLPQFLLSGTFFSTAAFPNWLQDAQQCIALDLT